MFIAGGRKELVAEGKPESISSFEDTRTPRLDVQCSRLRIPASCDGRLNGLARPLLLSLNEPLEAPSAIDCVGVGHIDPNGESLNWRWPRMTLSSGQGQLIANYSYFVLPYCIPVVGRYKGTWTLKHASL